MSEGRVYLLSPKDKDGAARLVRATSESQAYRHVARSTWVARVATQNDLIDYAVRKQVAIEEAKTDES